MITLFPDQAELVSDVRTAMRKSKSVLMTSPTGSGKTAMATHMIQSAKNKENRIIFTVPRKDLLEQTSESFSKHGIPHSFIAAGKSHNPYSSVYIGMIDTMARRLLKLPRSPLVIIDEARYGEKNMDAVVNHYKQQGSWLLGLDATPWKLSGKGLGCWYDAMVQGKSIRWLIDNKRLSAYRYFGGRSKIDLSAIHTTAGDYNKAEVADYMEHQGVIIGDCVRAYKEQCMGNIHLVRCASIKHSQMVAQTFREAGIPAMHVDGETPIPERKRIFRALALREILVVCFCNLLDFGFDLSQISGLDVCIESGSDLKPSKSLSSVMQWWGRLLRYKDQPAIINDHVNNYVDNGYPDDEREWTLKDREKEPKISGERASPIMQCKYCYFCSKPALVCPNCGKPREINSREIEMVDGELVELSKDEMRQRDRKRQGMARSLDELIAEGYRRGYQPGKCEAWAARIISARNAR